MNPKLIWQIYQQMGGKYVWFRAKHELSRKLGAIKKKYPTNPLFVSFITFDEWLENTPPFFFESREDLKIPKNQDSKLKQRVKDLKAGKMIFFSGEKIDVGLNYNWRTNPTTGFEYPKEQHWTEVSDLSSEAGDIKYVWEKSRFHYLYDLIRYDYHFEADQSNFVFEEIDSWIAENPINCGPNFKCSQEIALRSLNWIFALYYYKNAAALTETRFSEIMDYLYWSFKHIHSNIQFSLLNVRNNHAITEVATLFLAGLLFPFFPEAKKWKELGKDWLEVEIQYQIYPDGSYLQHSHNYHRVVMQVLTWALYLGDIHGDLLSKLAEKRIKKSLKFLYNHQVLENGFLPNYGANDGALFFPLNNSEYRDYRPVLNAVHFFLEGEHLYPEGPHWEDVFWYSDSTRKAYTELPNRFDKIGQKHFKEGGYFTLNTTDSLFSMRCASYKDRPAQADNLHIDLWYKGENVFRDAGTFRYNTDPFWLHWFNSTSAHNTVTLKNLDQMKKGPRFIWLNWTKVQFSECKELEDRWMFFGRIEAFKDYGKYNAHTRKVEILKNEPVWIINDFLNHGTHFPIRQHWHPGPAFEAFNFTIEATDAKGQKLDPIKTEAWYAETYGLRDPAPAFYFETLEKKIRTVIRANK